MVTKKKIIMGLARKSIIFKPFILKKMYQCSNEIRKKVINETIDTYTNKHNLSSTEKKHFKNDMSYCRAHYNLSFKEYFLFGFKNKNHFQRKKFIINRDRQNYLYLLGQIEGQQTLNDKYKTYELLKKFYKRDMIKIGANDYKEFENFVHKHNQFVKKPISSSFGSGIELIDFSEYDSIKDMFNYILRDGEVILEERIIQCKETASLHPESLNTLRIVTYRDEKDNVFIHLPFIKVGQGSSFVDNGGDGGILAMIDPETGIIITDGKDETNIVYEFHPDTNIRFKGFQIPKWQEVINVAKKAALAFDKTRYIGWDVAINDKGEVVIVEGNGKTQFLGQQIPDEIGKKKQLEKLINYKRLKNKNKNIKKWELPVNE